MEAGADGVGGAAGRGARVVGIEVLVHVEDEVVRATIRVGDAGEGGGGAARDKGRGAGEAVAWRWCQRIVSDRGGEDGGHVPGIRIIWVVAPALRIAVTAVWTEAAHEARPGTFSTDTLVSYLLGMVIVQLTHCHAAHSSTP